MSLVGTRPPTVDEWDKYELHHRARLATKPGLTGMWQVSGRSNITDLLKYLDKNIKDIKGDYHGSWDRQPFWNRNQTVGAGGCFKSYHHGLLDS